MRLVSSRAFAPYAVDAQRRGVYVPPADNYNLSPAGCGAGGAGRGAVQGALSCFLLEFHGVVVLLDAPAWADSSTGMPPVVMPASLERIAGRLDAVLLSSHRHVLALPYLAAQPGFAARVFCTTPSMYFGRLLLEEFSQFELESQRRWLSEADARNGEGEGLIASQFAPAVVQACVSLLEPLSYGHTVSLSSAVRATPFSTGVSLGSSFWIIEDAHVKIAYVSGASSAAARSPLSLDLAPLRGVDVLLLCSVEEPNPQPSDEAKIKVEGQQAAEDARRSGVDTPASVQDVCEFVGATLRLNESVLIPVHPSGLFVDLLPQLVAFFKRMSAGTGGRLPPCYLVSPCADLYLSYLSICGEWFASRQAELSALFAAVYACRRPCAAALLEPSIVFATHAGLALGPSSTLRSIIPRVACVEAESQEAAQVCGYSRFPLAGSLSVFDAVRLVRGVAPSTLCVTPGGALFRQFATGEGVKGVTYCALPVGPEPLELHVEHDFERFSLNVESGEDTSRAWAAGNVGEVVQRFTGALHRDEHVLKAVGGVRPLVDGADSGAPMVGTMSVRHCADVLRAHGFDIPQDVPAPGQDEVVLQLGRAALRVSEARAVVRTEDEDARLSIRAALRASLSRQQSARSATGGNLL